MNFGSGTLKGLVCIALAGTLAQAAAIGAYAAAPTNETISAEDAKAAQFLLQRAVALYKEIKDLALEHFGP
ncbi:MAG TPA: hypothetical protein VEG37_04085, partial [Burkholderiales bacterium]|nr:hypothetical protein [Burkholderiales bacterium]